MKKSIFNTFALLIVFGLIFTACDAPSNSKDSTNSAKGMENINVPSDFDWKTTSDIQFSLTAYQKGRVQILSENGSVFHQANLGEDNSYEVKLTIPAYVDELKVMYRGQEVSVNTSRSTFAHNFTP